MKKNRIKRKMLLGLIIIAFTACGKSDSKNSHLVLSLSKQLSNLVEETKDDSLKVPRSWEKEDGYSMVGNRDWCCGFPAGSFWYMYELTGEKYWESAAVEYTERLAGLEYNTNTHDLGFMAYCSFGNAYRITGNKKYREVLLQASESLLSRFDPVVGCIRSWDSGPWQFPVIIDNMMNLEMLFWATEETGDNRFQNVAIAHANSTLKNHFRENMSSYHVVDYDTMTGGVRSKQTHQGYGDETAWCRGQAWGLYGTTVCYRETKDPKYLAAAVKIAKFIINKLPGDYVTYWDFDDPRIPDIERDASASAIMASAFYELSAYVKNGDQYVMIANKILEELSSERYMAETGTNGGFILQHSVGNYPQKSEIDVPLNYADYYFLEAVKRQYKLNN